MSVLNYLSIVVEASNGPGYDLTCSVKCYGDSSSRSMERYEHLSHAEVVQVAEALLHRWRPGWEYAGLLRQPPLTSQD